MRINKTFLLVSASLLGAIGCGRSPELAFVDLSKVHDSDLWESPQPQPLSGAAQTTGIRSALPPVPGGQLYFAAGEDALRMARDAVAKNREKAFKQISDRLSDAAVADVKRIMDARLEAMKPEEVASIDAVYSQLRAIFLTYAFRAGSATFDLAGLVGFPDPDPKSKRVPDPSDQYALKRYERAKSLRTTIDTLDRQFYADFDSRLDAVLEKNRQAFEDLKIAMSQLLEQYLEEARLEAARLTEQSTDDVASQVALREVRLKPVPGFSFDVPAGPSLRPIISVPAAALTDQVRNDLDIFAGVKGYELTGNRSTGTDVTAEFIRWRRQFQAGR